ncbi:MAG: hypothetical protein PHR16_01555 [Methylovulum sp.]|nr:hypothetical protein [Methylovulum sp.]
MKKNFALLSMAAIQLLPTAMAAGYYPAGPQTNIPVATVTAGGWTQCYLDTYDSSGASLAGIQASCNKAQLMLACRPTGSATLQLLAQAPRADVLFDTGSSNTPHDANGTGWYYNTAWSWGFAKQGDTIDRNFCDIDNSSNSNLRLCWETDAGATLTGFRCGADDSLGLSNAFERIIYQNDAPVIVPPVPASVNLDTAESSEKVFSVESSQ